MKYISVKEFKEFSKNQDRLIEILNHNMTKITVDMKWVKRIGYYMCVIITGIGVKFIIL